MIAWCKKRKQIIKQSRWTFDQNAMIIKMKPSHLLYIIALYLAANILISGSCKTPFYFYYGGWMEGRPIFIFHFSASLFDHYEKDLKVNEKEMRCEQYFWSSLKSNGPAVKQTIIGSPLWKKFWFFFVILKVMLYGF